MQASRKPIAEHTYDITGMTREQARLLVSALTHERQELTKKIRIAVRSGYRAGYSASGADLKTSLEKNLAEVVLLRRAIVAVLNGSDSNDGSLTKTNEEPEDEDEDQDED